MTEDSVSIEASDVTLFIVCALLFLSGLSALIYEVAWVRTLGLVLGNSTQATSCVLAVFLGGLSLGAVIGGKFADRGKFPHLLAYGCLELGVGIVAPLVSAALTQAPHLFVELNRLLPQNNLLLLGERLAIAALLLLLPTVLMGATLPILTKFLTSRHARAAHHLSLLYGLNTFGAALGSLCAAFITFPYLGVTGTIYCAASVNLTVATLAYLVWASSRRSGKTALASISEVVSDTEMGNKITPEVKLNEKLLFLIAALCGFTALSYEVLFMRFIRFYTNSNTYSFTLMVSSFLFGLALGSWFYNRLLKRYELRPDSARLQMLALGYVQYTIALVSLVVLLLLPGLLVGKAFFLFLVNGHESDYQTLIFEAIATGTYLILPATLIGISFPAIGGMNALFTNKVGNAVGSIYALNTIGCVCGSAATGLIFIPLFGSQATFQLIILITAFTALVCLGVAHFAYREPQKRKRLKIFVPFLVVALALLLVPGGYLESAYGKLMSGTVDRAGEDPVSMVLLFTKNGATRLIVNGTFYSSNILNAQRYMRMIGEWPTLLHHAPKEELSICFGIGTTSGSIVKHPDVEKCTVVELSPTVIKFGPDFKATNGGVLKNAKTRVEIEDGRNYLLRTKKLFDVISFEPPPPCDAGIVSLYSKEFYELCKKHLKPGGIVCQWVPMEIEPAPLWKMMVKTMSAVFPQVTVWNPSSCEGIALGSMTPIEFDPEEIDRKINQSPAVKKSLEEVGFPNSYSLLATYLMGGEKLRQALKDTLVITDDHPYLEFYLPYAGPPLYAVDLLGLKSTPLDLVKSSTAKIDIEQLQKQQAAISLMRQAAVSLGRGRDIPAAERSLTEAHKLLPDNAFFLWAKEHPEMH